MWGKARGGRECRCGKRRSCRTSFSKTPRPFHFFPSERSDGTLYRRRFSLPFLSRYSLSCFASSGRISSYPFPISAFPSSSLPPTTRPPPPRRCCLLRFLQSEIGQTFPRSGRFRRAAQTTSLCAERRKVRGAPPKTPSRERRKAVGHACSAAEFKQTLKKRSLAP